MENILKQYNIDIIKENNQIFVEGRLLANLLELRNIRVSINSFSSEEKCLFDRKDSQGNIQKTMCLTEK